MRFLIIETFDQSDEETCPEQGKTMTKKKTKTKTNANTMTKTKTNIFTGAPSKSDPRDL